MSVIVDDGAQIIKDPDSKRIYEWDWDDLLEPGVTIIQSTMLLSAKKPKSLGASPPTIDSGTILAGSRSTLHRIQAGTLGYLYTLTNRITTSENPQQIIDKSVTVLIEQE